jgi:N-acetylneuraminic acid mutarotase
MIVWGGIGGAGVKVGGRYDPAADTWAPVSATNAPAARRDHTAVWTGSHMIVWGGDLTEIYAGYTETGGRYDPATDAWTPTFVNGAPLAKDSHTAVWTGSHMIVWGGNQGSDAPVGSGGRYDPATDDWSPTSMINAPVPRMQHTAVWTGSSMVVWGGVAADTGDLLKVDTGGRYDPLGDAWTATSTIQAPAARARHTAVWTGTRMVVWGGTSGAVLQTGGRYDPLGDSWTPMTIVNAPVGRVYHTAVWTGNIMVVWGGAGGGGSKLDSGGRYDPAVDTWLAPTSTSDAPSARVDHTAVWTGSHMIVWGGIGTLGALNRGAVFDPVSNGWTPVSPSNAPTARGNHTAVWTGTTMVVWGGDTGNLNGLDTGGRYDPAADGWLPTSEIDAADPRAGHTAVWTGSLMIVWGGASWPPHTGGRYALGNAVDDDGDGLSECAGDCNDVDDGAFAVPAEVTGLMVAGDKQTLFWDSAVPGSGTATVHDVVRGTLGEQAGGAGESCLAPSVPGATASDAETPVESGGFWYLVRGRNVCGPGTYGHQSDGTERSSTACP